MLVFDAVKRMLIGNPFRSERLSETLLPKRIALPVFASDALSSVAYAPDEIFLTLATAGVATLTISPWVGAAVVLVMLVVVSSYRQNVVAYPSGGGDYEVGTTNLGPKAGLLVASALLCDYVLTVAVSVSSGAQYAAAAIPALQGHEAEFAVVVVIVLMTMNLRGLKEAGAAFAVPTYIFMAAIIGMCAVGLLRWLLGDLPQAESASLTLKPEAGFEAGLVGLGGAFLLLRAFSSGCAALTGVEAISNGVPAFKPPKSKNAATTLALLGGIAVTMLMGIITLANVMHVRYAEFPAEQLYQDGRPVGDSYLQDPIIGQLARGVFSGFAPAFYLVAAATGVILVLAANTAFNGFPVLTSILAQDDLMPHQLRTRGDRLAFSNGIIILSVAAIVLIVAFNAEVTRLIQLYIVGVFISFTVSQTGMVRHWTRLLRTEPDASRRREMKRARVINATGLTITGGVLVVVLITKFSRGAWITLLGMACLFVIMMAIKRHYSSVRRELAVGERRSEARVLPSRVHAIVLVSNMHKPTLRALAYARAARPSVLEALTVAVEPEEAQRLQEEWFRRDIPVPLRIVESPYREITRPIVEYVTSIRKQSPRDLVVVYIPEYVVGHWWEAILHNQSALRLRNRLHHTPGVMIASVPWQLRSSAGMEPLTATEVEKLAEPDGGEPPDSANRSGGEPPDRDPQGVR